MINGVAPNSSIRKGTSLSTSGTGLFASDTAQDFLEELAEMQPEDRVSEIGRVFGEFLDDRSRLMRTVFPETLIAAAALVAIGQPGGRAVLDRQSAFIAEAVEEASIDGSASYLASHAIRALDAVSAAEGAWSKAWIRAEDREEAMAHIDLVRGILQAVREG